MHQFQTADVPWLGTHVELAHLSARTASSAAEALSLDLIPGMVRQWLMDVDACRGGTVAEILLVFLMGCGGVGLMFIDVKLHTSWLCSGEQDPYHTGGIACTWKEFSKIKIMFHVEEPSGDFIQRLLYLPKMFHISYTYLCIAYLGKIPSIWP